MVHWWCPRRNHKNSVKAKKSERPGPTWKEADKKPQLTEIPLREGIDRHNVWGFPTQWGDSGSRQVLLCWGRRHSQRLSRSHAGFRRHDLWVLIFLRPQPSPAQPSTATVDNYCFQSRCPSWPTSSPSSPYRLSPAVATADLVPTTTMTITMTRSLKGWVNHMFMVIHIIYFKIIKCSSTTMTTSPCSQLQLQSPWDTEWRTTTSVSRLDLRLSC